jgi:hypothetical protein
MKKIWVCVVVVISVLFAACYEINEDITITEKGSGTYSTKIDMSALLQMMQSMASEEEIQKSGLDRYIDTVINLKSILDTAKNVTPNNAGF